MKLKILVIDTETDTTVGLMGRSGPAYRWPEGVGEVPAKPADGQRCGKYMAKHVEPVFTGSGSKTRSIAGPTWDGTKATETFERYDPPAPPPPTVISWREFQDRFTETEFDAATRYCHASEQVEVSTGVFEYRPIRPKLVQSLARVQAANLVDLEAPETDTFLTILVNQGIITEARKTEVLTP